MSEIEHIKPKSLINKIQDVEKVGILHVKGYSMREIGSLMSLPINEVKEYIHFFNEQRPAYSLNYLTPTQYRKLHYERISD